MIRSRLRARQSAAAMLVVIVMVSVALRVATALYLGDSLAELPGIDDQVSYHTLALRVLGGYGFSFPTYWWPSTRPDAPTAHWSFLYTLYLIAVYSIAGPSPLIARLIQAVVAGVLHPWLAWRLGGRLFGPSAGLVAAGLTAVYAYFVYYAGALMTETLTILAVLWVLDLATGMLAGREMAARGAGRAAPDRKGWVLPWLLGLAIGVAALSRQVVLVFMPALFVWLLMQLGNAPTADRQQPGVARWRAGMAGLLATAAVVAVMILPWTVRNYWAFGRVVPLNTNAGFAFFWANHPIHGTEFMPLLPAGTYPGLIPQELRGLDEAAMDQALLREGLRVVADDPVRYARLSLSRVKEYFKFWPSEDSGAVSNLSRVLSFGACLPLMLYGLFLTMCQSRRWVSPEYRPGVVLLCLFVAIYSAVYLLSWSLIRYRLPVDAVLILFAAPAVLDLRARLATRRVSWPPERSVPELGSS